MEIQYDAQGAAAMLAALLRVEPEHRTDTLALVCRVFIDGNLKSEAEATAERGQCARPVLDSERRGR
jgi:hypothetical protein